VPIYVYRCSACGHAQDVLQKLSDPLLTTCPECRQETYEKQVTAAGFRLKGTGWYETDFRGKRPGAPEGQSPASEPAKPESSAPSASASGSPGASTPPAAASPS